MRNSRNAYLMVLKGFVKSFTTHGMNNMKVRIVFPIYSRVDFMDKSQWRLPLYGIITTSSADL